MTDEQLKNYRDAYHLCVPVYGTKQEQNERAVKERVIEILYELLDETTQQILNELKDCLEYLEVL